MTGGRLGRDLPGQAELSARRVEGGRPPQSPRAGTPIAEGPPGGERGMPRGRDMPAHAHPMRAGLVLLATGDGGMIAMCVYGTHTLRFGFCSRSCGYRAYFESHRQELLRRKQERRVYKRRV
jgi:hypothetical protein